MIQAALSNRDSTDELIADNKNSGQASIYTNQDKQNDAIKIDVRDADCEFERLEFSSIDFGKVDIQGAEYDLLTGNDTIFDVFQMIVIEIHPSILTPDQTAEIYEILEKSGSVKTLSGSPISKQDMLEATEDISLIWRR